MSPLVEFHLLVVRGINVHCILYRYETKFVKEALGVQIRQFHENLEKLYKVKEEAAARLHDVNRRLRAKRRELAPLEKGVVHRTLEVGRTVDCAVHRVHRRLMSCCCHGVIAPACNLAVWLCGVMVALWCGSVV